jgi:predicted transport protein
LTGYNSKYSDRSFEYKKTVDKGFNESPLRLNKFIREQEIWTAKEMEKRSKDLAAKSVDIWPALIVDIEAVRKAELEERKAHAAKYSLENLEFDPDSKLLFDLLRAQINTLGDNVIELCTAKSITYRVYDFFLEIIPRKRRIALILNLDYEVCDDPTHRVVNASEYAYITFASERGGVLFSLEDQTQMEAAMHIIRQAYLEVSN